jgi:hypothetical protein
VSQISLFFLIFLHQNKNTYKPIFSPLFLEMRVCRSGQAKTGAIFGVPFWNKRDSLKSCWLSAYAGSSPVTRSFLVKTLWAQNATAFCCPQFTKQMWAQKFCKNFCCPHQIFFLLTFSLFLETFLYS